VSRARLSSLLLALLVVLGGSAWATEFAPPIAFATSHDGSTHGDALTASRHVEVGVVARTLRTPLPCASTSRACDGLATIALPLRALGPTPAPHCPVPLYALLRVYRL